MFSLAGKKCIITGGGSGIGLAIAKRFVDEGSKVLLLGRDKTKLDNAVQELQKAHPVRASPTTAWASVAQSHVCDVADPKQWETVPLKVDVSYSILMSTST
jgi:NAD(P)-dependent dehydrogenase (short-subunit alcohol dehydrogenase family)